MIDTNEIRRMLKDGEISYNAWISMLCDEIDRLSGEKQTPTQGKRVRVEVQVNTYRDGTVIIPQQTKRGHSFAEPHNTCLINFITATLPVPAEVEVVAKVEGE